VQQETYEGARQGSLYGHVSRGAVAEAYWLTLHADPQRWPTSWYSTCSIWQRWRRYERVAPRHPCVGPEPTLPEPNIQAQISLSQGLSHRYAAALSCPCVSALLTTEFLHLEPPEVTFEKSTDRPIPIHPHIYSNGIICLDLLGQQGWSPVQSAQSVCMSIQSMLTSNTKNERPPGDEDFVKGNKLRPRDIDFLYHDNTV
jgi:hypothetical protein